MATFDKRGKVWRARVNFKQNGKYHQKSKSGFKTKQQAQLWASKMEVQKSENVIVAENPSFGEYYKKWSETYRIPGKSTNTIGRYRHINVLIKKYFGNEKLNKVSRMEYQNFLNDYGKNHSKNSIQKVHGTISACVHDAIIDHLISTDFTARANIIFDKNRTKDVQYLSVSQTKKLIEQAESDLNPRYNSRYMIITAIYTGMRIGEIMALKWSDINFKSKTIDITKSYSYASQKIKEPKTPSSIRTIRVNQKLLNIIQQLKKYNHEYVFGTSFKTVPTPTACNKVLKKLLKQCNINIPGFHFHSLRHTHTSILLYKGVDLYAISQRLGHSNMSITAKVYAHMIDELKAKTDYRIEKILDTL